MSSEKLNHTTTKDEELIKQCCLLLSDGDYKEVREIINKKKTVSNSKLQDEFERAGVIADILYAAENPLPDGSSDLYGMVRVTPPGPLLVKDFVKIMYLLCDSNNQFPFSDKACIKALSAWSLLCSQAIKDGDDLSQTQGIILGDIDVGGSISGDGNTLIQTQGNFHGDIDVGGNKIDDGNTHGQTQEYVFGDIDVRGSQTGDGDTFDQTQGYVPGDVTDDNQNGDGETLDQNRGKILKDIDVGNNQSGDGEIPDQTQGNVFGDIIGNNQSDDWDILGQTQRDVFRDIFGDSQSDDGENFDQTQENVLGDIDVGNNQNSDGENLDQTQENFPRDIIYGSQNGDEDTLDQTQGNVHEVIIADSQMSDKSGGHITDVGGVRREDSNGGEHKRKREINSFIFSDLLAPKDFEDSKAMNVNPFLLPPEKTHALHNESPLEEASFVPKNPKVGPQPDDEVIIISDDEVIIISDDEEEEVDGLMDISMARTAKRCIVNGIQVKMIPCKKEKN
ncbi:hypothetical protein CARUB_v10000773mg [Capsella rubella]|uniref:Uncharacterized protein n=1 Tax=Capsella rubella TaxID=81985 RepID=R0H6K7_9BRAS|nr:hypothetical protein CARUB_v10000773mg [Capsella rubella]